MTWQQRRKAGRLDLLTTPIMRVAAWTTTALLASAYLTGEEVQHTHAVLGYGLAAVLVAIIGWESIRPHEHRTANLRSGARAGRTALTLPSSAQFGGPALIAAALMCLVGGLALVALAILWVTHSFWRSVDVDEAHEAVAYISLGLAVFYVAMVIVGTSNELAGKLRTARHDVN